MRAAIAMLWVLCVCAGAAWAQDSCIPYVLEPCDGDPQSYECVNVTTELTSNKGGETTAVLQEFCFKVDSPLIGEITVWTNQGTLAIPALKVGDAIGELLFSIRFSDFGQSCPLGNDAIMRAPITVTEVSVEYAKLQATISEASVPLIDCLLKYDPTDQEHNNGLILEGEITASVGGGFELYLKLPEPADGSLYPGLEYGDLAGSASPVPLYFRPLTRNDVYTLPPAGGTLAIGTLLGATNLGGLPVEHEFLEEFTITPGVVAPQFRRGDVNEDAKVDIADPIKLLGHLFSGLPRPDCPDAADANDDGKLDIADAIKILGYLFSSTGPLPDPFGDCGAEAQPDTDGLPACDYKASC
ncbi:MAG TPA: hypothetical protein DCM87_08485 [Planctomycetes bacterium]|nr:hypothetical protein [Planctomycetota bacterium]